MLSYLSNPVSKLKKVRDLTLIEMNDTQYLVIACDSDGGIGNKPHDFVKVPEETIGSFAVRVPLFEVISCGASPFLVIDCLSVEMKGSGSKIISAIKKYAKRAGITNDIQFTGSTEDNVPTIQTGVGITVIGIVDKEKFFPGTSETEDVVVCAGIPKSGPKYEVRLNDPEILSIEDLMELRKLPIIKDILPVGSKGIEYEVDQLANSSDLRFILNKNIDVDLTQSAGPSTCVLFTTKSYYINFIASILSAPIHLIGYLGIGRNSYLGIGRNF